MHTHNWYLIKHSLTLIICSRDRSQPETRSSSTPSSSAPGPQTCPWTFKLGSALVFLPTRLTERTWSTESAVVSANATLRICQLMWLLYCDAGTLTIRMRQRPLQPSLRYKQFQSILCRGWRPRRRWIPQTRRSSWPSRLPVWRRHGVAWSRRSAMVQRSGRWARESSRLNRIWGTWTRLDWRYASSPTTNVPLTAEVSIDLQFGQAFLPYAASPRMIIASTACIMRKLSATSLLSRIPMSLSKDTTRNTQIRVKSDEDSRQLFSIVVIESQKCGVGSFTFHKWRQG